MVCLLLAFWKANLPVIHFGYGLIFFLMGFAVALLQRAYRESRLPVARHLPWLSAFGMLVGLAQWGVVFIPLQAAYLPESGLHALRGLHAILLLGAHACLLLFGLRLSGEWESNALWLGGALVAGGLGYLLMPGGLHGWYAVSAAVAAYGLGLPGAVLSGRGLLLQRYEAAKIHPRSARWLLVAALSFVVSVPLGPLAVAAAGGEPAHLSGIPVEVPLALGGMVLAISLLTAMEVLRAEQARRLEKAERREAALAERDRLAKEINDGVIQDLFAAGMLIGAAGIDLPEETRATLRAVEQHLQLTVDRLREHITSDPDQGH